MSTKALMSDEAYELLRALFDLPHELTKLKITLEMNKPVYVEMEGWVRQCEKAGADDNE